MMAGSAMRSGAGPALVASAERGGADSRQQPARALHVLPAATLASLLPDPPGLVRSSGLAVLKGLLHPWHSHGRRRCARCAVMACRRPPPRQSCRRPLCCGRPAAGCWPADPKQRAAPGLARTSHVALMLLLTLPQPLLHGPPSLCTAIAVVASSSSAAAACEVLGAAPPPLPRVSPAPPLSTCARSFLLHLGVRLQHLWLGLRMGLAAVPGRRAVRVSRLWSHVWRARRCSGRVRRRPRQRPRRSRCRLLWRQRLFCAAERRLD